MKKITNSGLACLIAFTCTAQLSKSKIPEVGPKKYINAITTADIEKHVAIIASDDMEGRETGSYGQKKTGNYIIEQYKKNNIPFPKGAIEYYQRIPAFFLNEEYNLNLPDSENIWAYIEGSEKPEEVVVLSAHYDHIGIINGHIFNGADDNASGTAAIIEIAKAFAKAKKEGKGPKRSILILHVTAEEHGLHGSRFYTQNPLFSLKNTVANVNIDMIGRRDDKHRNSNNYIYLIGSDRLSTNLDDICKAVNKKYFNMELDYTYNNPKDPNHFYERSDHYNFAKYGVPSVFLFNGLHDDYHQATDDSDKIEFDALTKRTQLAFMIMWEIANRNERIVVDKVQPTFQSPIKH